MKEFERKMLLTESQYAEILLKLKSEFNYDDEVLQFNYYYDTLDLSIYNKSETLRVRQIENILKLQYKYNKKFISDMRISDEYEEEIKTLPLNIKAYLYGEVYECQNIGLVVTNRINIKFDNCLISLDKNYYLGTIDYEIEIEDDEMFEIPTIINYFEFAEKAISKYERLIKKMKSKIDNLNININ